MGSNDIITPLLQAEQAPTLTRAQGKPSECRLADNSCFLNDGSSIPGRDQLQVQRKLIIACVLCFFFMVMEVIGGWLANSVAIMSDAAHMFSDMSAFAVALFAAWAVTRKSHASYSFGYHRAEIVGALVSIAIIWLVTGALVYEAILRTITPVPVDGRMMFIVATGALLFNVALMLVVGQHHHHGGSCSHDHGGSGGEHNHGHDHGHGHSHDHSHHHSHGSHSCSHSHSHQTPIKRSTVETLSPSPAMHIRTRSGLSSALLSPPAAVSPALQRVVVEGGELAHHQHVDHSHTASSHDGHQHTGHTHGTACCHGHDHHHGHAHDHDDHSHNHDHDQADDHNHQHDEDHEHAHVGDENHQHGESHTHSHHGCSHSHGHDHDHDHHHDHDHVHSDSTSPSGAAPTSKGAQKDDLPPGCQCAVITVDGTGMAATALSCECVEHGGDHDACMRLGLQLATELARKRQEQQRKVDEAAGVQRSAVGPQEGHLGLRSAAVHILGDMIQSIGVAMAGALIWWNQGDPRWYYADPICTYLFSIMVLLTTRAVMKDIIDTLMERTPVRYNLQDVADDMGKFEGIRDVHDLHIWNLAMGLPILTAHIHISSNACPEDVLTTLERYVGGLGISHSTIQICNMPQPSSPSSSGTAQDQ